jgi:PIN domain nuclease of toxin-antitoxin system
MFTRIPFDRLLIAQASEEGLILLTSDEIVGRYPIRTLW